LSDDYRSALSAEDDPVAFQPAPEQPAARACLQGDEFDPAEPMRPVRH
jgi:hypothetical protein